MPKRENSYTPELIILIAGIFTSGIAPRLAQGSGSAAAIGITSILIGIISIIYRWIIVSAKVPESKTLWVIGTLITLIGAVIIYLFPDGILSSLILYAGLAMLTTLFLHRG